MPHVTLVGNNEPAPSWDEARSRLLALRDGEFFSLGVDGSTWLVILYIAELGYLVSGQGVGDRDYFTLIERGLGDEPVTAFDGGNLNEYPRHTFVSAPTLFKAARTYYSSGVRDSECEWVPAEDAVY